MAKFRAHNRAALLTLAVTIFLFFAFRQRITILPMAPSEPVIEPLPPAPQVRFVDKRLAQKPDLRSSAPLSKPSRRMIELYKIQAVQRRAYMKAVFNSLSKNYMFVYNNMAPEVFCPELVRVGTTNDGGKWICSPFRIPDGCVIFSLGMYNEVTFEQELQYITNKRCSVYAYDSNEQAPATLKLLETIRTKAMKATIAAETDIAKEHYTINDLMVMENVDKIEIFKIDIEGSEFTVIPGFLAKHKPAQIIKFPWIIVQILLRENLEKRLLNAAYDIAPYLLMAEIF
ncbi:hypothetical protein OESDEN_00099 [Oesophagostomum dentatum]|uniref:Methyltransferase domain-containing protein n=1 Tax=Oesophagostomum dentatum TaxID=61180 RepID=A0A0B1TRK3_OESDE|nr:hypothetical protein OESDEN_00099 [Oesophagostomum dentatum]